MDLEKRDDVHVMNDGFRVGSPFFCLNDNAGHALQEQARIEIELREPVDFALAAWLTMQWRLVRKPAGSTATMQGARLAGVDRPGVYRVECRLAGRWSRTLDVCAFDPAALYRGIDPAANKMARLERRLGARSWLNSPDTSEQDVLDTLEKNPCK